jgi:hypothetical protein
MYPSGIQQRNQKLMDLEAALESPVFFQQILVPSPSGDQLQPKALTMFEVILKSANQLGGSHTDVAVEKELLALRTTIQGFHTGLLLEVGNLVTSLGRYVLEFAKSNTPV